MATITSSEVRNDDGVSPQDGGIGPLSGGDVRPTKKRRGAKSSEKGDSTRKQEELCQLNLDVLFLVVEHGIEPIDLLNLACTCKSLRGLLMNKTSEFIWRAARRHVDGLPDCPPDLSEPEYASLLFCAQCHGCGKPATTVLWKMRRRYCPSCKRQRLCKLSSCKEIVRDALASESLTVSSETSTWVERSQMESFLYEYRRSYDKGQFLSEKRVQRDAIYRHARHCGAWHEKKLKEHKNNLAMYKEKRKNGIFQRLHQLGYTPEIRSFGMQRIQDSYRTFFWLPRPLKDQEWDQTWPVLHEIMENFRSDRLDQTVYGSRRNLLASEYKTYMESRKRRQLTSALFPHAYDLAHFGPFQSIIKAPEGASVDHESFAAAFQQLPDLVDEWRKKLEAELAEVVMTALALPSSNIPNGQGQPSSSAERPEAVQMNLDILNLASAVFFVDDQAGSYAYPDVFFVSMCDCNSASRMSREDMERTGSLRKKFGIAFLNEARHIVRTCGLNPTVATAADMDGLNARLRCLSCEPQVNSIMNWRAAMWHAREHKRIRSQWQLVSDEHINAIEAVERSVKIKPSNYTRCLLCQPCVGGVFRGEIIHHHLHHCHNRWYRPKRGVHYVHVGICDSPPKAEIVQGREVTFRKSTLL